MESKLRGFQLKVVSPQLRSIQIAPGRSPSAHQSNNSNCMMGMNASPVETVTVADPVPEPAPLVPVTL